MCDDLPYDLWCEVICHLRDDGIFAMRSLTRSALRATQTVPLTFDEDLDPFRTLLLLRKTLVPLRKHRFVLGEVVQPLSYCVAGIDVEIKGYVVSRSYTDPANWVAGACVLTRCGVDLVAYDPDSSHARVIYEINRALLDRR